MKREAAMVIVDRHMNKLQFLKPKHLETVSELFHEFFRVKYYANLNLLDLSQSQTDIRLLRSNHCQLLTGQRALAHWANLTVGTACFSLVSHRKYN